MSASIPELDGVKFDRLNLTTLRASCGEVLKFEPTGRKLREAYEEVLGFLNERAWGSWRALEYLCAYCRSPIDDEMEKCWACGSVFGDEKESSMESTELEERARKLGVDTEGKSEEELTTEIEEAETLRRLNLKDANLSTLESKRLNERLSEELPDRWRKKVSNQFVGYHDPSGIRRVGVFHRGLKLVFTVEDGMLDDFDDLEYLDDSERRRLHYGRSNYVFRGDVSEDALKICRHIFSRYSE